MEFLNNDLPEKEPTDEELRAYPQTNVEIFRSPDRFSFQQIYCNPQRKPSNVQERILNLLAQIRKHPASANSNPPVPSSKQMDDASLLPAGMQDVTAWEIANVFGSNLVAAVKTATHGEWTGPHRSAYGLHLLRVTGRNLGDVPPLDEIRPVVEREWANEQRQMANERFYRALRDRYTVAIQLSLTESEEADNDQLAARP